MKPSRGSEEDEISMLVQKHKEKNDLATVTDKDREPKVERKLN